MWRLLSIDESRLDLRVDGFELTVGVGDSHLPVDAALGFVDGVRLGSCVVAQGGDVAETFFVHALTGQAAEFVLDDVEPAAVFGSVTELDAADELAGSLGFEGFVEHPDRVRVEVVAHEDYFRAVGVTSLEQTNHSSAQSTLVRRSPTVTFRQSASGSMNIKMLKVPVRTCYRRAYRGSGSRGSAAVSPSITAKIVSPSRERESLNSEGFRWCPARVPCAPRTRPRGDHPIHDLAMCHAVFSESDGPFMADCSYDLQRHHLPRKQPQ